MERYYTIAQLEAETGIPHQTIRRYIDKHGHHLKTNKKHKSVLVAEESLKTLEKIRLLYADRLSAEEVDNALSEQGIPVTIAIPTDDEKMVKMDLGAVMSLLTEQQERHHLEQLERMESNKAEIMLKAEKDKAEIMRKQEEDRAEILREMKRVEAKRDEKSMKRDEKLMEVVRSIQEVKQLQIETAATTQKKPWWQIWK